MRADEQKNDIRDAMVTRLDQEPTPSIQISAEWLSEQITAASEKSDYPAVLRFSRDRALVLLAFFGRLDFHQLSTLTLENVCLEKHCVEISGARRDIYISAESGFNAVSALKNWIVLSDIKNGPLFRRVNAKGVVSSVGLFAGDLKNIFDQSMLMAATLKAQSAGPGAIKFKSKPSIRQ